MIPSADEISFVVLCIALISIAAAFTAFLISQARLRRRILAKANIHSEPLTDDQFHQEYFRATAVPRGVSAAVRRLFIEETGINVLRMSAHEDLSGSLGELIDGMDLVEFTIQLEEEFAVTISDEEAASCKNFFYACTLVALELHPVDRGPRI